MRGDASTSRGLTWEFAGNLQYLSVQVNAEWRGGKTNVTFSGVTREYPNTRVNFTSTMDIAEVLDTIDTIWGKRSPKDAENIKAYVLWQWGKAGNAKLPAG